MRYFTKEVWAGWQDDSVVNAAEDWKRRCTAYRRQLARLSERISPRAMRFFTSHSLHDARLMRLNLSERERGLVVQRTRYPLQIELHVLTPRKRSYTLTYSAVRKVVLDYPSDRPLFLPATKSLGDWGYDELTGTSGAFLQHEILFSSGSTLLIEFKNFKWCIAAPAKAPRHQAKR
jgi:hypothetical protein